MLGQKQFKVKEHFEEQKHSWSKSLFDQNTFWVHKKFGLLKFFGPKDFGTRKFVGSRNFIWADHFWGIRIFGSIESLS